MKSIEINNHVSSNEISLGMWGFSGGSWFKDYEEREIIAILNHAIDKGINLIDTAPVYGFGRCENILGKVVKQNRSKIAISTKCGIIFDKKEGEYFFHRDGYDVYKSLSKESIIYSIENSLRNLKTDYIDIVYTHFQMEQNSDELIEEVMDVLMKLKEKGVVGAVGAANVNLNQLLKYEKYGGIDIIQEKYNLLDRKIEQDILPCIRRMDIPLHIYSPLEMGLLSGNIKPGVKYAAGSARAAEKSYKKENVTYCNSIIDKCQHLIKKYNCNMGNIALAWLLKGYRKSIILCGASSCCQIEDNILATGFALSNDDYIYMKKLFERQEMKYED